LRFLAWSAKSSTLYGWGWTSGSTSTLQLVAINPVQFGMRVIVTIWLEAGAVAGPIIVDANGICSFHSFSFHIHFIATAPLDR
jgi:hypothetical protein